MAFGDAIEGAIDDLGKMRLKARFVFRAVGAGGGTFGGAGGGLFVLPLNPQQFIIQRPTLGRVHLTENGAFEDDFGLGLAQFQIQGTFGYKSRPAIGSGGLPLLGMDALNLFQDMVTGFYSTERQIKSDNNAHWDFYDLADLYFFRVRILSFDMSRQVREPMLHFYTLKAVVLEDYFSAGSITPRLPSGAVGPVVGGAIGDGIGGSLGGILGAVGGGLVGLLG